jgi:hypothetical protein
MLWGLRDENPHQSVPITKNALLPSPFAVKRIPMTCAGSVWSDFDEDEEETRRRNGSLSATEWLMGNVDGDRYSESTLKQLQARQLFAMNHHLGKTEESAIEAQFEKELFNMSYRLDDRIFGWMPWGMDDFNKNNFLAATCSICTLIIFYGAGLTSFILQNQRITVCEQGLVIPPQNYSCRGMAAECLLAGGQFINYKAYVQYRLAAYILLIVPFLYIPYMTVVDMTLVAKKVWEKINPEVFNKFNTSKSREMQQGKTTERVKVTLDRKGTWEERGSRLNFTHQTIIESCCDMTPVQNEYMLLFLFTVFHIILGGFSIAFDSMMAITNTSSETACGKINTEMDKISDLIKFDIRQGGIWNLSVGAVCYIMTFYYMYRQLGNTLHKNKRGRDISNRLRDKEHEEMKQMRQDFENSSNEYIAAIKERNQRLADAQGKEQREQIKREYEEKAKEQVEFNKSWQKYKRQFETRGKPVPTTKDKYFEKIRKAKVQSEGI